MRTALWCALLLGLVAAAAAAGANPKPAILGGVDAPKGRFRYIASLRATTDPDWYFCGGTLIHPWVVLTAAHCVREVGPGTDSKPNEILVRIGGYTINDDPSTEYQQKAVQKITVHPRFKDRFSSGVTQDPANFDVALLLLSEPSTKATVKLVGQTNKPALPVPVGSSVTVAGWGPTNEEETTYPKALQLLQQSLLSLNECQKRKITDFPIGEVSHEVDFNFFTNSMICAARDKPVSSFCHGDSGGPLLVTGSDASEDHQIGVVSWSPEPCSDPTSVYTDVGMVFNWIQETVFKWTGDRLKPWSPPTFTGSMLANSKGIGFNGKPFTYSGAAGKAVDIASNAGLKPLGWFLNGIVTNGSAPNTQALGHVFWNYGARVEAQIGRHGHMVVHLNKQPIWEGTKKALGKLVTIEYARQKCGRAGCEARKLEITVRPFIKVAITQPWVAGALPGAKGSFAPYLEVSVTLYDRPKQQLTGYLGQTIKP